MYDFFELNNQRIDMRTDVYGQSSDVYLVRRCRGLCDGMAQISMKVPAIRSLFYYYGRNAPIIPGTNTVYPDIVKALVGILPLRLDRRISLSRYAARLRQLRGILPLW